MSEHEELAAGLPHILPPEEKPKTVPLTPEEKATLTGLVAARDAVIQQIDGYLTNVVCARLGVHRTRVANADIQTGLVTLSTEPTKE